MVPPGVWGSTVGVSPRRGSVAGDLEGGLGSLLCRNFAMVRGSGEAEDQPCLGT